jgi:hypothetical protein
MDEDFMAMMSEDPNRDPVAAYQDVCTSNLGHLVAEEDREDIFFHVEHSADIQATHDS